MIARVLESRYHLSERNQQRPTLCSMLFGQRHTSHININLHQHHWSKSPAHNTSACHYVICSLFETLSAQFLSSSCPNAASLVTITRNSTNSHTYCGTRGATFHLSHVGVGKCFVVLHVQYANFLAFSRLISRTIASNFPGASTPEICPMFGRCIRSFSCLVWRLLQSSDTFRSRAEWSHLFLECLVLSWKPWFVFAFL